MDSIKKLPSANNLLELQVEEFTERQGGEKEYGLVGQSFVTALREELTEYYRLLAVLEAQVPGAEVVWLID